MATENNGAGCGRARTVLCTALIAALLCGLCGCGDESKPESSQPAVTEKTATQTPEESADTEPKTLEQELLKKEVLPLTIRIIRNSSAARGCLTAKRCSATGQTSLPPPILFREVFLLPEIKFISIPARIRFQTAKTV